MTPFIVSTGHGLTTRLIEAIDAEAARAVFLRGRTITDEEVEVREATDSEIAAFGRRRRRARPGPDQLTFGGMPAREQRKRPREFGL